MSDVNIFDEPVGWLMIVLITDDRQHDQHAGINDGRASVIEIGGLITDWLAVNPGG